MVSRLCVTALRCLVWAVLTAGSVPSSAAGQPEPIAFVDVNVVPMDRERILPGRTVIVRGGRIVKIEPAETMHVPKNAHRIDGRGKYLMPGLADMHVHILSVDQLTLFVANGVTTVRNMVGTPVHLFWRDQIGKGDLLGPTIYTAGPMIDGSPPAFPFFSAVVKTPKQARRVVAVQKEAGYDFIKVFNGVPKDAYEALMEAAQTSDMQVVGHVPRTVGIERALAAGQRSLEHLIGYETYLERADSPTAGKMDFDSRGLAWHYLDEGRIADIVSKTREAGAWNCPTLTVHLMRLTRPEARRELNLPHMKYVNPGLRTAWLLRSRGVSENVVESIRQGRRGRGMLVRALHDAGARILLGTDSTTSFVVHGFSIHDELKHLVDAGLTPYEAIKAGTRDAAEFFGALDEFGTVAAGRRADLILLDANPLEDVAHVKRRVGVMVRGRWFPQSGLQAKLDALAERHANVKIGPETESPATNGG